MDASPASSANPASTTTSSVAMEVDCKITPLAASENTKKTSTLGRSRKKKAAPQPPTAAVTTVSSDSEKSGTSKKNPTTSKSASSGGGKKAKTRQGASEAEFLAFKVRVSGKNLRIFEHFEF